MGAALTIVNTGSISLVAVVLTELKQRCQPRWKAQTLSTGRSRPNGPWQERTHPPGTDVRKTVDSQSAVNQAEDDPWSLAGDGRVAFATEVGIKRIGSNIVVELATETVLAHSTALCAAIHKTVRSLALPYLEMWLDHGIYLTAESKGSIRRTSRTGDDCAPQKFGA